MFTKVSCVLRVACPFSTSALKMTCWRGTGLLGLREKAARGMLGGDSSAMLATLAWADAQETLGRIGEG